MQSDQEPWLVHANTVAELPTVNKEVKRGKSEERKIDCLFDETFTNFATMAEFLEGNEEDERKVMESTLQNKEKELYNVHPFFAYYP